MKKPIDMQCPCNPNKKYIDCCKKAHQNINSVTSAETLMRSRYSAFVLANIDYLQKSHHSKTRPSEKEKTEILNWTKSVDWIRLEILNATIDTVTFRAIFMEHGKLDVIFENSFFCKENGHWVYKNAQ
jgi:SEC-C motif-containing protein